MDTNFQTYLESLFLIANAELSDEYVSTTMRFYHGSAVGL